MKTKNIILIALLAIAILAGLSSCKKDHDIPTGKVFNASGGGGSTTDSLTIIVSAHPSEGGVVSGGGKYLKGKTGVVTASANEGYVFSNWTENGTQVSTSVSYSFTVDVDRTLVANFSVSTGNNFNITAVASPEYGGVISGSGTYQQGQNCTVTATANADYTFTYWTENNALVSTDATYSFTVEADRALAANFAVSGVDGHPFVDLGLPSGLLWATCNVGADSPEDYGDYFAWGETQPKSDYSWGTYQYCMGSNTTLTKYCNNASYGYNGYTDNLTVLEASDDAATANWGSGWRMPTKVEWQELLDNTTYTWTFQNGVYGQRFTASNGNSLFLPAASYRNGTSLNGVGVLGCYWSSSLNTGNPNGMGDDGPSGAWDLNFHSLNCSVSIGSNRDDGMSVRPVRSASKN